MRKSDLEQLSYLNKLIELASKMGLKKLRAGEIEFEFGQKPVTTPVDMTDEIKMPSEDEMLFYSTDAFDDIKQDREGREL